MQNICERFRMRQTGHAILVVAHHEPHVIDDCNLGMVMGMEYLAAVLERRGWNVDLICGPRGEVDLERCLDGSDIAFVGISSTTPGYRHALQLGRTVRRVAPDVPIVEVFMLLSRGK